MVVMHYRKLNRESRNVLNRAEARDNVKGGITVKDDSHFKLNERAQRGEDWTRDGHESRRIGYYDNMYGGAAMTTRASAKLRRRRDRNRILAHEVASGDLFA